MKTRASSETAKYISQEVCQALTGQRRDGGPVAGRPVVVPAAMEPPGAGPSRRANRVQEVRDTPTRRRAFTAVAGHPTDLNPRRHPPSIFPVPLANVRHIRHPQAAGAESSTPCPTQGAAGRQRGEDPPRRRQGTTQKRREVLHDGARRGPQAAAQAPLRGGFR